MVASSSVLQRHPGISPNPPRPSAQVSLLSLRFGQRVSDSCHSQLNAAMGFLGGKVYDPVYMSRKGAWLMLLVALLWFALPASACLLTGRSMVQSACCRGMASNCPMHSTGISCMCCPGHENNAAVAPAAQAPATQVVAFLPFSVDFLLSDDLGPQGRFVFNVPPPDPSPGRLSVLRI